MTGAVASGLMSWPWPGKGREPPVGQGVGDGPAAARSNGVVQDGELLCERPGQRLGGRPGVESACGRDDRRPVAEPVIRECGSVS